MTQGGGAALSVLPHCLDHLGLCWRTMTRFAWVGTKDAAHTAAALFARGFALNLATVLIILSIAVEFFHLDAGGAGIIFGLAAGYDLWDDARASRSRIT